MAKQMNKRLFFPKRARWPIRLLLLNCTVKSFVFELKEPGKKVIAKNTYIPITHGSKIMNVGSCKHGAF